MMKPILLSVVLTLLPFATSAAQETSVQVQTPKAAGEAQREPPAKPVETGQAVNVKVELTITDQATSGPVTVRTVSLLAADNSIGRIRAVSPSRKTGELNVDARPRILTADRLQLALTVEYRPGVTSGGEEPPSLSQSLTVVIRDATPLVVSQSADPNSDRKVKMEVKATVLR
jgi:hypothetical protein